MGPQIPQRVVIVGAGPVGLCNARTLLDDGFDVTIVTAVRPGLSSSRPFWVSYGTDSVHPI